jgi:hypothetical protein
MKDTMLDGPAVIARRAGSYNVTPNGLYGGKVVSKASLQKMTTPFKGDYGLGIYIRTIDGRRAATHGGGAPPFANLTYFLDRGISVVVLGNLSVAPAPQIAGYLGALAHGDTVQLISEKKAITLPRSVLTRYAGVYQSGNGQSVTVKVDDAQLVLQPTGGNALTLLAESETRFFIRNINLVVDFVLDAAGSVTEIVVVQGTRQERATRVK